ncbi:hypothetical protein BLNAU_4159 [Blattamonas nauphoetae]|uniref:Uncharacterized protein n=1 Tax=Blattamonas nauphoetae TaxID=2049346 RepID=A0ABQ9YAG1_9EUKA|nr:hypothetical protein BLNAU_4159 [Blattamonas nauphoetae]
MDRGGKIVVRQPPQITEHPNDRPPQYSSILVASVVVSASAILEGFVPERVWGQLNTIRPLNPYTNNCLNEVKQYLVQLYPLLQPSPGPRTLPGPQPRPGPHPLPDTRTLPGPHPLPDTRTLPGPHPLPDTRTLPGPHPLPGPQPHPGLPPPFAPFDIILGSAQHIGHLERLKIPQFVDPAPLKPPKRLPPTNYDVFASSSFSANATTVADARRQLSIFAGKVSKTNPTDKDRLTEAHIPIFQTLFASFFSNTNPAGQVLKPEESTGYIVGAFRTINWNMATQSSHRNSLSNVIKQQLVSTPKSAAVVTFLGSVLRYTDCFELTLPVHLFDIAAHVITKRRDLDLAPISTTQLCQILIDSYSSFHRRVFHHFEEPLQLSLDSREQNENLDRTTIVAPFNREPEPALGYASLLTPRLNVMERIFYHWKEEDGPPNMRLLFFEELDKALTVSEFEMSLTIFWAWCTDSSTPDKFRQIWTRELNRLEIGPSLRNPIPSDERPFPVLVFDPQRKNRVITLLRILFRQNGKHNHPNAVIFIRILLSLLINPSTSPELSLLSTVIPKEQNQTVVSTLLQNLNPALTAPETPSQLTNTIDVTTTLVTSFRPPRIEQDVLETWTTIDTLNSSILGKFDKIYETVNRMDTTLTRLTTPSSNTNWQLLFSPKRKGAILNALSRLNRTQQQIRALTETGGSEWFVRWLTNSQFGQSQELNLPGRSDAFGTLSDILDARSPTASLSQLLEKFRQLPNLLKGLNFGSSTNVALILTISSLNSFFTEYNSFLPPINLITRSPGHLTDSILTTLTLSDREVIGQKCRSNAIAKELISLNLLSSAPPLLQQTLRDMKFDSSRSDTFPDVKTAQTLLTQFDLKVIEGLEAKGITWLLTLFILILSRSNKDKLLPTLQNIIASLSGADEPTKTIVKRAILNLLSALLHANTLLQPNPALFTTFLTFVAPIIRPHLVVLCSTLLFIHLWSSNLTQPVHKSFDRALHIQAIKHMLDMIEKGGTLSHLTQILEISLFDTFTIPHFVFAKLGFFSTRPHELLAGEPELLYRLLLSTIPISPVLSTQTLTSLKTIQEAEDRTEHSAPTRLNSTPLLSHHHISFMESVFDQYQKQFSTADRAYSFLPVFFSFYFNTLLHMSDLSSSDHFYKSLDRFQHQIPSGKLLDYFFRQHSDSLSQKNRSSLITSFFFENNQTSFNRFEPFLSNDIFRCLSQSEDGDVNRGGSVQLPPSVHHILSTLISLLLDDLKNPDRPHSNLRISQYFSNQSTNHQFASALLSSSILPHNDNTPAEPASTFVHVFSSLSQSYHRNQDYLHPLQMLLQNLITHTIGQSWNPSAFVLIILILCAATQSFIEVSGNQHVQDGAFPRALVDLWKHAVCKVNQPHTSTDLISILGSCWSFIFSEPFFRLVLSAKEHFAFFVVGMVYPTVASSNDLTTWKAARDWCLNFINISTDQNQQMSAFDAFLCLLTIPSNNRQTHISTLQSSLSSFLQTIIARKETTPFFEEITRRISESTLLSELVLCEETIALLIVDSLSQSTTREHSHTVLMSSLSKPYNTNGTRTSFFPDFLYPQGAGSNQISTSPQQHPLYPVYLFQLVDIITRSQQPLFLDLVLRDFVNLRSAKIAFSAVFLTQLFCTLAAVPKDAAKLWPIIPDLLGDPHHHKELQTFFLRMNSQQLSILFSNQTPTPLAQPPLHQLNEGTHKFNRVKQRQTENIQVGQDISNCDHILNTLLLIALGNVNPIEGLSFLTKLIPNLPQSVTSLLLSHTSQCLDRTFHTTLPRISLSIPPSSPHRSPQEFDNSSVHGDNIVLFLLTLVQHVEKDTLNHNVDFLIRLFYLTISSMSMPFTDPRMRAIYAFVDEAGWRKCRLNKRQLSELLLAIFPIIITPNSLSQQDQQFALPHAFLLPALKYFKVLLRLTLVEDLPHNQQTTLHSHGVEPDVFNFLTSDTKAALLQAKLSLLVQMKSEYPPEMMKYQILSLFYIPFRQQVWIRFRKGEMLSQLYTEFGSGEAKNILTRIVFYPDVLPDKPVFSSLNTPQFTDPKSRRFSSNQMSVFCDDLNHFFTLLEGVLQFTQDCSILEAQAQTLFQDRMSFYLIQPQINSNQRIIYKLSELTHSVPGMNLTLTSTLLTSMLTFRNSMISLNNLSPVMHRSMIQEYHVPIPDSVRTLLEFTVLFFMPKLSQQEYSTIKGQMEVLIKSLKQQYMKIQQTISFFVRPLNEWMQFLNSIPDQHYRSEDQKTILSRVSHLLRGLCLPAPPQQPTFSNDGQVLITLSEIFVDLSDHCIFGDVSMLEIESKIASIQNLIPKSPLTVKNEIARQKSVISNWQNYLQSDPTKTRVIAFFQSLVSIKVSQPPRKAPKLSDNLSFPQLGEKRSLFQDLISTTNKTLGYIHDNVSRLYKDPSKGRNTYDIPPSAPPELAYLIPPIESELRHLLGIISDLEEYNSSLGMEKAYLTSMIRLRPPERIQPFDIVVPEEVDQVNNDMLNRFNQVFRRYLNAFSDFVEQPLNPQPPFGNISSSFDSNLETYSGLKYVFRHPANHQNLLNLSAILNNHPYRHMLLVHRTTQTVSKIVEMTPPPLEKRDQSDWPKELGTLWNELNTFVTTMDKTKTTEWALAGFKNFVDTKSPVSRPSSVKCILSSLLSELERHPLNKCQSLVGAREHLLTLQNNLRDTPFFEPFNLMQLCNVVGVSDDQVTKDCCFVFNLFQTQLTDLLNDPSKNPQPLESTTKMLQSIPLPLKSISAAFLHSTFHRSCRQIQSSVESSVLSETLKQRITAFLNDLGTMPLIPKIDADINPSFVQYHTAISNMFSAFPYVHQPDIDQLKRSASKIYTRKPSQENLVHFIIDLETSPFSQKQQVREASQFFRSLLKKQSDDLNQTLFRHNQQFKDQCAHHRSYVNALMQKPSPASGRSKQTSFESRGHQNDQREGSSKQNRENQDRVLIPVILRDPTEPSQGHLKQPLEANAYTPMPPLSPPSMKKRQISRTQQPPITQALTQTLFDQTKSGPMHFLLDDQTQRLDDSHSGRTPHNQTRDGMTQEQKPSCDGIPLPSPKSNHGEESTDIDPQDPTSLKLEQTTNSIDEQPSFDGESSMSNKEQKPELSENKTLSSEVENVKRTNTSTSGSYRPNDGNRKEHLEDQEDGGSCDNKLVNNEETYGSDEEIASISDGQHAHPSLPVDVNQPSSLNDHLNENTRFEQHRPSDCDSHRQDHTVFSQSSPNRDKHKFLPPPKVKKDLKDGELSENTTQDQANQESLSHRTDQDGMSLLSPTNTKSGDENPFDRKLDSLPPVTAGFCHADKGLPQQPGIPSHPSPSQSGEFSSDNEGDMTDSKPHNEGSGPLNEIGSPDDAPDTSHSPSSQSPSPGQENPATPRETPGSRDDHESESVRIDSNINHDKSPGLSSRTDSKTIHDLEIQEGDDSNNTKTGLDRTSDAMDRVAEGAPEEHADTSNALAQDGMHHLPDGNTEEPSEGKESINMRSPFSSKPLQLHSPQSPSTSHGQEDPATSRGVQESRDTADSHAVRRQDVTKRNESNASESRISINQEARGRRQHGRTVEPASTFPSDAHTFSPPPQRPSPNRGIDTVHGKDVTTSNELYGKTIVVDRLSGPSGRLSDAEPVNKHKSTSKQQKIAGYGKPAQNFQQYYDFNRKNGSK